MDPATSPDDRQRRRLLIAATTGGLVLLVLVGVGVYGLLRGPATPTTPAPSTSTPTTSPDPSAPTTGRGPSPVPQTSDPEAFARAVAHALFTWDTTTGNSPSDYAQVLADVAAAQEADAFVGDVRAYLPTPEAWAQLRPYATSQHLTIDQVFVPETWQAAVAQAAPGQIPDGATAYTIEGTRHRQGISGTAPVEASRPVAFTVFVICTPTAPGDGAGSGSCEVLRLSRLDNPLR
ncbi:hypothetical protein [Propionibacterium freudenreichii]|uniref:hypothetical protein n=1 Tax=Propionibacterium freudenreichii TaxID=1744 RepID=UPI0005A5C823|nr:hypothetical protein [Propionibacterium freudenreichii]MDK9332931.1 hypothetical protein [Propionibacterium freudenreichii]CEI48386.1 Putative uncharacterized protein [Propionibacterium freudenreichii]